jgi:hypothetical protein
MYRLTLAALAVFSLLSSAAAQGVVKREPPLFSMTPGTAIYVDDGKCGRGKIKLVRTGSPKHMLKRQRSCVERPAGM